MSLGHWGELARAAHEQHERDAANGANLIESITGRRPDYVDGGFEVTEAEARALRAWLALQASAPADPAHGNTAFGIPIRISDHTQRAIDASYRERANP